MVLTLVIRVEKLCKDLIVHNLDSGYHYMSYYMEEFEKTIHEIEIVAVCVSVYVFVYL